MVEIEGKISRRTIAKGTGWAVPVVAVAAAVPAQAATLLPGLQGWVLIGRECTGGNSRFNVNGNGDGTRYPAGQGYGLYVHNTSSSDTLTDATIWFMLPTNRVSGSWTLNGANQGWSVPVADSSVPSPCSVPAGYTAYKTSYSGLWTCYPAGGSGAGAYPKYCMANGVPIFYVGLLNCATDVKVYACRSVKVNGTQFAFLRDATV